MPNVLNEYAGDGVTQTFNFSMTDGYLSRDYVVFQTRPNDSILGYEDYDRSNITWLTDFSVRTAEPIPVGTTFAITRATPAAALVDFQNTSRITERNLDTATRQSLHRTVETADYVARGVVGITELAEVAVGAAEDSAQAAELATSLVLSAEQAAASAANSASAAEGLAEDATNTADAALQLISAAVKGNVDSFNGRDGVVLPKDGDYTPPQVGFALSGELSGYPEWEAVPAWGSNTYGQNAAAQVLTNRTELLNQRTAKAVLSYPDYAAASAAAATLPGGQELEAPDADWQLSRFAVQSGALVFKDFAPDAIRMQSYVALRAYTGKAGVVYITTPGIAGRFIRDDADTTTPDNGGTVIVDATGRRWKRVYSGAVYVQWFGATGVGDSTSSIQAAINNSAGEVSLGDGKIFAVSRLVGRSNLKLSGKSTLDFSGNPSYASTVADPLIKFAGSAGAPVLVTSDVINGATIINVASTDGISAGDIIEIATPAYNGGFIDTSVVVRNGELVMVESVVSSTQLSLSDPILDEEGFSVANGARVRKITQVENVEISSDVTILGKGRPASGPGDNGVVIFYGKNVSVHAKFYRVDLAAVRFESCYQYEASGCVIVHDKKGANEQVNYGIVPSSSSKYGKVFRNHASNMRHGVVTSHLSSALGLNVYGVVRELDIFDNDIRNTWHAGIATHNDAEFVRIKSNRVVGSMYGINVRERNIEVSGNTISFCVQGVYLTGQVKNAQIINNIFQNLKGSAVFSAFATVRGITDLEISGNVSINTSGGIVITLPDTGHTHSRISIINNTLSNIAGVGGAQHAIRKTGAAVVDLVINNNTINGATGSGGIGVSEGGTRVLITNNRVINVSGNYFTTLGTFVTSYGKGNFGGNWSGASGLTNGSAIFTDNTLFM